METVEINEELLIPSGRHTLPPEEVEHSQRQRLMRAMAGCAGERGYQATTIADVVAVAHTSRSAFYKHFADKQSCFLEAYREMTTAFIKASLDAAAEKPDWRDKLDAGIGNYFRWMAEHPGVATSTIVEIHSVGPAGLEARRQALENWMRTVEGVAVLARREGAELPELDETAYTAIILTAEGYVHDYARQGKVEKVMEVAPRVQTLARRLFGIAAPNR